MLSPTHRPPVSFTFLIKQTIAIINSTTHKAAAANQTKAHIRESPLMMPMTITMLTMAKGIVVASKPNQNAYLNRLLRGNIFSRLPLTKDSLVLRTGGVYISCVKATTVIMGSQRGDEGMIEQTSGCLSSHAYSWMIPFTFSVG